MIARFSLGDDRSAPDPILNDRVDLALYLGFMFGVEAAACDMEEAKRRALRIGRRLWPWKYRADEGGRHV